MEVDEEYIQIKTISDSVSESVVKAYRQRFRRFDLHEKSVIMSSLIKIMSSFLLSLSPDERGPAIAAMFVIFKELMYEEDQNM